MMNDAHSPRSSDTASLYSVLKLAPEDEIRLVRILPRGLQGNATSGVSNYGRHGRHLNEMDENEDFHEEISPRNPIEEIECEVQVVQLRNKPKYIALSYTWGSPVLLETEVGAEDISSKPSRPILCTVISNTPGGPQRLSYKILVSENLYSYLLRVRDDNDESHAMDMYWIDAICINQNDPEEQSQQVNMMAAIYQSADIVYAWLGEADADTDTAFQLINALACRCVGNKRHARIEPLKDITPKALESGELTAKIGPCATLSTWKAMARHFNRRYFTRVWTIQEITLAKKMIAICGKYTIDWENIVKVSEFLTVTSWTRWISEVMGYTGTHAIPNLLDANKTSKNMLYSLIRSRRFTSKDPRDKVYALLGVAGEAVRGKARFTPVYGERSIMETYTLAAIQILEDSNDLLLLTCAEGDTFHNIPLLPSWVPDWTCIRSLGLGVTGYHRYSAAGTLPRSLVINEQDRSLAVKGFRLDDIVYIGETKQDVLGGKPFPNWIRIINKMPSVYETGACRAEVFWRTLITDTAGAPPSHPAPYTFRSAYVSWIKSKYSMCVKEPSYSQDILAATHFPGSFSSSSDLLESEDSEASNTSVDAVEYETMFAHARHLRPFLTGRRYVGVGSESLREHDSVWIIPGSRVPLILREVESGVLRVVGGAYVYGFMQGEALIPEPLFRNITLV